MILRPDFVSLLQCPITGQPLREARDTERVAAVHRMGRSVGDIDDLIGVAAADGAYFYPVRDGIWYLTPDAAISLSGDAVAATRDEKVDVTEFYDGGGWSQDEHGDFADARLFEDLRPVSRSYVRRSHARVTENLPARGGFFLDVASGPVQYPEYLEYSRQFHTRVCVDLSVRALREARRRIGAHGIFVRGDITSLPFRDRSFDAVVSLHTIYHVPADEQRTAFIEVHRVLAPGGKAVVVYSWRAPAFDRLFAGPVLVSRLVKRKLRRMTGDSEKVLYFAPQTYRWFVRQKWPFSADIRTWRSVSVHSMNAWVRGDAESAVLRALAAAEDRFPRLFGRVGRYPLIVIFKQTAT